MRTLGTYGSGLDTNAIVAALVNAEVAPLSTRLDRQERERGTELSSLGGLKSSLASIESALTNLGDGTAFNALSISSPDVVTVTQSGEASVGRFDISVSSLAKSQSLYSGIFAATSTVVGTGTLTIAVGTPSYESGSAGNYSGFTANTTTDIVIDTSNNTVAGVRDAINAADAGVTAAILLDGDDVRLVMTSDETGAANAISVTVADADGTDTNDSGLSQLAYHYDTASMSHVGRMSESRSAADAIFSLNGIDLSSESNTIDGLIDGLNFELKAETASAVTAVVEQDRSAIIDEIETFIDTYNTFQSSLSSSMSYNELSGSGVFQGDSMVRQLSSSMRTSLTNTITGLTGDISLLSSIGITADRYGQLAIDNTVLEDALASDLSGVREFFAGDGNTDGMAQRVTDTIDVFTSVSTGLIVSREASIESLLDRIEDQRLAVERRAAALETRYLRQFTAMDALVGQLQSTSDFLTNQLKNIPGQNSN